LLFGGDYEPAAAQLARSGDGDVMLFIASAMARGQGKTEGLHERTLILTGSARRKLGQPEDRAVVALRATARVVAAEKMRSKVLYPALKQIALGDTVVAGRFDALVDQMFFDHLFATIDLPEDEARVAFDARAREFAWNELQRAIDRCCVPDARRLRAISEAERMFHACLGKNFPDLVAAQSATARVSS
jgi:CRISPR system Cascade subunit CasA